ncbi:MAG: flagellar filament capping protein FliD [Phycisphaerales bacterium]
MGGITTGVGLFSGIDSASLIEQLIASQSRPQILASQRLFQLQTQQAAYLDINSRVNSFKTAAASFRVGNIFDSKQTSSSNEDILTATASNSAINGTYNFIIDRLVSSQQLLSRGFADQDSTPVGLSELTFEGVEARLDRDTALADLNNGNGISRGKIVVNGTEVDLSRVATVGEVLDAINDSGSGATASVSNGSIVLDGVDSLNDASGSEVLDSFGLSSVGGASGITVTSDNIYGLGTNTALSTLNDGRGVGFRDATGENVFDFNIVVDGTTVGIRIGEIQELVDDELTTTSGAASSTGQVIDRINDALTDADFGDVVASIDETNGRIAITNSSGRSIDIENITIGNTTTTTATDLGIETSATATGDINGDRILAGLNTTLLSSINGGRGLDGTNGSVGFVPADGSGGFFIDVSAATTIEEVIDIINNDAANDTGSGPRVVASLNENGNGLKITDNTGGSGSLVITSQSAIALGIDGTFADGVSDGENLQLAYLGSSSLLANLRNGSGIGTGTFEIVDSQGNRADISISDTDKTLGDIINKINDEGGIEVTARINDTGDGIIIEDTSAVPGAGKLTINDTAGSVARNLNLEGTASGTDADNFIDGSFEITIEFDANDTLQDVVRTINENAPGANATIINDGAGANPFRLSLIAADAGVDGRFIVDTGGFDLGFTTLEEGNDSRVFYGSTDPARGVLLSNSSNTLDGVIAGVSIDLTQASSDPVTLSITTDTESIESKVQDFVAAFNSIIERIDFQTRFNDETLERGPLLGDGTAITLRNRLFASLQQGNDGFTGAVDRLSQVGITVGEGSQLEFDAERFRTAYANDPGAVEDLFTRRDVVTNTGDDDPDGDGIVFSNPDAEIEFSALGIIPQLENLADSYVSSIGGILQNRKTSLDSQIQLQQDRIESIELTLNSKREILQRQFLAMEQAIAGFQSQGSALSQISLIG